MLTNATEDFVPQFGNEASWFSIDLLSVRIVWFERERKLRAGHRAERS